MSSERELARGVVDEEEQEQESKEEGEPQEEKGQETTSSRIGRLLELTARVSTMINSAYSMVESDELDLANDAYRSAASLFLEAKALSDTIPKPEIPAIVRMSLAAQIPQRMAALKRKLDEDQQPQSKRARSSTSTSTSTSTQPQTMQIRKLCASSSSNPASVWENLKTIYNGLREAGVEIHVAKPFSKKTLCQALAEHFKIPSEEMEIAATLPEDTLSDPDKWPSQYYDATTRSVMLNPWEVRIVGDAKRFMDGTSANIEWVLKQKMMPETREEVKYTRPSSEAVAELEDYSLKKFGLDLSSQAKYHQHVNFIVRNWKPDITEHFERIAFSTLTILLELKVRFTRAKIDPQSFDPYIKFQIQNLYNVLSPPQREPPSLAYMQLFMMKTYELFARIRKNAKLKGLDASNYDFLEDALRKMKSGEYFFVPSSYERTKAFFFQYLKDHTRPAPVQAPPSQDQIERFMYEDFMRDFESLKQWMLERLEGSGSGRGDSRSVDLQTPSNRRIHAIVDNTPVELEIQTLEDLITYIRDIIRNFTELNVRRVQPSSARHFNLSGLNVSNPALVNSILWIEELKKMIQIANQTSHQEALTQILDRITTLPSYIDIMTSAGLPAASQGPASRSSPAASQGPASQGPAAAPASRSSPADSQSPLRVLDAAIRDEFVSGVRLQVDALLDRVEDALMANPTLPNVPVTYRTSEIIGRPETIAGLVPYLRTIMNRFETLTTLPNPDIMRAHRIQVQDPTNLMSLSWILEMGEVVSLMRTEARNYNAQALRVLLEELHERILGMNSVADAYRILLRD